MSDPYDPAAAIRELIESYGYTEARIAEEIREHAGLTTSQSSINRIKGGKQAPRFDEGMEIIRLRDKAKGGSRVPKAGLLRAG